MGCRSWHRLYTVICQWSRRYVEECPVSGPGIPFDRRRRPGTVGPIGDNGKKKAQGGVRHVADDEIGEAFDVGRVLDLESCNPRTSPRQDEWR